MMLWSCCSHMFLQIGQVDGQVQGVKGFADLPRVALGLEGESPFVLPSVTVSIRKYVGLYPLEGLCNSEGGSGFFISFPTEANIVRYPITSNITCFLKAFCVAPVVQVCPDHAQASDL